VTDDLDFPIAGKFAKAGPELPKEMLIAPGAVSTLSSTGSRTSRKNSLPAEFQ
jgi:hypothetical protein